MPASLAPEPAGLRLWGVFGGGETCWWLPADRDPDHWPLVLVDADGIGWQRLNLTTTAFLDRWLDGDLDLPVLSTPPARRERRLDPQPTAQSTELAGSRDALRQLQTIVGPSTAEHPEDARPIHPEPGGLLFCASTESRDILWWDTTNPDPDQWTITWDVEFRRHRFTGTLTDLLIADLTGRLQPPLTYLTPSDAGPD